MALIRTSKQVSSLGLAGLVGVVVFLVVCTSAQYLRADLDWIDAPLSFYLVGPGGWVVKLAYFGLSVSLLAIGAGFYGVLHPVARSGAPLLLFAMAAVALTVTAVTDVARAHGHFHLSGFIHIYAAGTTFLCVTVAMLMQSERLRLDQRWAPDSARTIVLARVAFVALWIYALTHELPKGLMQKMVIVLILAWLARAAIALWRHADR